MKDEVELPGEDFRLVIDTEEVIAEKNTEQDNLSTKIADLSKRGYQLLKENDIQGSRTGKDLNYSCGGFNTPTLVSGLLIKPV